MKYAIASYGAYLFATRSSEQTGGNHKQEWLLAKSLAAAHHDVMLIVPSNDPLLTDNIDGVRIVRCSSSTPALLHVINTLRREKPDWFHVMGSSPNLFAWVEACHLLGIKCAFALAHDHHTDPRNAMRVRRYMWPLYALGLRAADRILVQHPHQIGLLAPAYRSKAFLVNNIVEAVDIPKGDQTFISWVGWLRQLKRPHLLIEIAKALPKVKIVVVGPISKDGEDLEYGEKVLADFKALSNIDYRGYVSREETQQIIAQSALLLSTARAEGFPNTFLEAWVTGVPTLSLEIDPGDVMNTYHTGLVVSSVDELIHTLDGLLSQPDKLHELGQNAYQYVKQNHSGEHVSEQLEVAIGLPRDHKKL